ncbi:serine/threonine-protein kinase [Flavobacterium sp.]|uniref:serine/threonine-protein kinase n=1 Tax=Flavobacterium sp. TaxID=239 RepID=UPI003B9CE7CE
MNYEQLRQLYKFDIEKDFRGNGAFSVVFKAKYNDRDNYQYAIKRSEVKFIDGKKYSLEEEFKVIKDLSPNDNIAYYKDVINIKTDHGEYDYIIMEYYPYGNLSKLIKLNGVSYEEEHEKGKELQKELSFDDKENIAVDILKGLSFLHKNNRIHRDLKPSNILIHYDEKRRLITPLITDFGLSKIVNQEVESFIENSVQGGTVEYSSPEQIKGDTKIYYNTDLWAYGVIIYELFTGKSLFNSTPKNNTSVSRQGIGDKILNEKISENIEELPKRWQKIAEKCLVRDPNYRVKTADELLDIIFKNEQKKEILIKNEETVVEETVKYNKIETPLVKTTHPQKGKKTGSIEILYPLGKNFTYSINDGKYTTEKTFLNLNPGTYKVSVKDEKSNIKSVETKILYYRKEEFKVFLYIFGTVFFIILLSSIIKIYKDNTSDDVEIIPESITKSYVDKKYDSINSIQSIIKEANSYFDKGEYKSAIIRYRLAIEKDQEKSRELNYYLGVCYFELKDYEEAKKLFASSITYNAENQFDALNYIGLCFLEQKNYQKAYEFFKDANTKESFYNIGLMYENGYYLDQSDAMAYEYYNKAYINGYEPAKKDVDRFSPTLPHN